MHLLRLLHWQADSLPLCHLGSQITLLLLKIITIWASLAVQWLRLHTSIAGGVGSILGQRTKVPHVTWWAKNKEKKNNNYLLSTHYVPGTGKQVLPLTSFNP